MPHAVGILAVIAIMESPLAGPPDHNGPHNTRYKNHASNGISRSPSLHVCSKGHLSRHTGLLDPLKEERIDE
ncbi:uncharacterized protein P174DRAFT_134872 [Aspergillus novofumigatus IBT 16806]|uniref:Secreted protein n=1 Tax=Aspergillus novofumigatus (strain IBT 16806) TaxID=1392255 RepID=A0A2I1CD22_ASPN1|nr:uncharacterized protein P174DRAFT_134872 [Aspergillus novofumigatus IBT 16806]PKX95528.1 hypothetical protein P174DRAFT_134872 [Aspergillus novofumigatus IBT 16806]